MPDDLALVTLQNIALGAAGTGDGFRYHTGELLGHRVATFLFKDVAAADRFDLPTRSKELSTRTRLGIPDLETLYGASPPDTEPPGGR